MRSARRRESTVVDVYVYGLVEPRTKLTRYVGQTVNLQGRFKSHLKAKGKTYCATWIRSLQAAGLEPELIILGGPYNDDEANDAEIEWIANFPPGQLTNHTEGGFGVRGWVPSSEWKAKQSARMKGNQYRVGHKHSPETLKKISPLGRSPTLATREKIRAARKGWQPKPETLKGMSATWFAAGHEPWNKGKKGSQVAWNKDMKGVDISTSTKMSESAKNRPKVCCVRCHKRLDVSNLQRHLKACYG